MAKATTSKARSTKKRSTSKTADSSESTDTKAGGSDAELATEEVNSEWVEVSLDPQAVARLRLDVSRFANDPSYETYWSSRASWPPVITGRAASP